MLSLSMQLLVSLSYDSSGESCTPSLSVLSDRVCCGERGGTRDVWRERRAGEGRGGRGAVEEWLET